MNTLEQIVKALKDSDDFLVFSHMSPDGDTIGSATALIRALRKIGKKANFACADVVHENYSYMFNGLENEDFQPKSFVSVDIAGQHLLGEFADKYKINIAIDHHKSNSMEADYIYVDSSSAANTMIIYEVIRLLDVPICEEIANSLYTGLATDTGCFKYSNTSEKAHLIAADLISCGANHSLINRLMFDTKTLASIKMESEVFSNMEFLHDNKILIAVISKDMMKKNGADEEDLQAIPGIVRSIQGVYIGVTLKEKDDGRWKVSIRAMAPCDASVICLAFGGGGHRGAGGCFMGNDLAEAKNAISNACVAHITGLEL